MKEPLIETRINLPVEPIMELVPSLTAMSLSSAISLRSPDIYDPLYIFLHKTRSQEISLLMVQNAVRSVFITKDLHLSATCDWLDLQSFTAGLSRKQVSPPLSWFNHDASVLILQSSPWPDWGFVMRLSFTQSCLPYLPLHSSGMNIFKAENDGRIVQCRFSRI